MRVRMLVSISGGRGDGTVWPHAGGELDVDDAEGAELCAARLAVPVPQAAVETPEGTLRASEERRGAESPAEATEGTGTIQSPAQNAPKAAWVAYAAARGMPEDEAAAMSKADLIAALG
jgi:hypothetical protein